MEQTGLRSLLEAVASGEKSVEHALDSLKQLPYEDIGFANLDHHRSLRWGFPEVVFCQGKTPEQSAEIMSRLAQRNDRVLGTRATATQYAVAKQLLPELHYSPSAGCIWIDRTPERPRHPGVILVAAGTSDLPVLEEAAITLDLLGHQPQRIADVGVAGLHRLFPHVAALQSANVVVVIAGMEGALASVVGGLTNAPVIAVPTSVGYGASFGGLAALLAMLNSCATGVAVVNIDNGFGAGFMAAMINQKIVGER